MDKKYFESSEFYSKKYNNFSTIIIIPTILLLLVVLIFSFFAKREIAIDGTGSIEPNQQVPIIQSTSTNYIKENYLNEGKQVHKRETLLTYNSTIDQHKVRYYSKRKRELEIQVENLKKLKNGILGNKNVFKKDDNFGYSHMLKHYLAQRMQILIENRKINKNYDISQINNAKLKSLQMQELEKTDQEQIEIEQKIQDLGLNLNELNSTSKQYKIKAPKSGILHINEKYKNAEYIPAGSQIAEIYPNLKYQRYVKIISYISVSDISSVKKGQKVRLKVTRDVPKPIIITGTIKNISVTPIILDKSRAYLITSMAKVSESTKKLLKYGMVGSTTIITGEKTFFNYYKDKLFNKT